MPKLYLFLLSIFFYSSQAQANTCAGNALLQKNSFDVVLGDYSNMTNLYSCKVTDKTLNNEPLEITGCYPQTSQPEVLLVKAPKGWTNSCFESPPSTFMVVAKDFKVEQKKSPLLAGDCPPPVQLPLRNREYDPSKYGERSGRLSAMLNDLESKLQSPANRFKTVLEVEQYHKCMLSGKTESKQNNSYLNKYRHMILDASTAFGIPSTLLTCLCGRESRFNANATSHTGAQGACQATSANLEDIQKWRDEIPAVEEAWEVYIAKLGPKLEDPSCANLPLSKDLITRCPSLAFGAASTYLTYAYANIEKNTKFKDLHWHSNGLKSLVTIAAAYNVGVGFSKANLKAENRNSWDRDLILETCRSFGAQRDKNRKIIKTNPEKARNKAKELQNHMIALRNCMQDDNFLDHQGKPLGGDCSMSREMEKVQLTEWGAYKKSLDVCP